MAIMKNGIFGSLSGRIGSLVGKTTKGKAILTTLPTGTKANKSPAQLKIESGFGMLRGLGGLVYEDILLNLLSIGNQKTTILSEFVRLNFPFFKTFPVIEFSQVIFSRGDLLSTPIKNVTISGQNERARITWNKNWSTGSPEENDLVYAIVINEGSSLVSFSAGSRQRKDKSIDVQSPEISLGDLLHVYLAFNRGSNSLASNTSYKQKN